MRLFVAALVTALAAAGCGGSAPITARPSPGTSLSITVRAEVTATPRTVSLTCDPAGGTHPDPAAACTALARVAHPFAALRRGAACTEIYGGAQLATVTGSYRGEPVHARFRRSDGCEIARWDAIAPVFPIEVGAGR